MTMSYCIQVDILKPDLQEIVLATFEEIYSVFNNWNPESEISKLNALPANQPTELSPPLADLLQRVDHLVTLTEGRFDPTVASIKERLLKGKLTQPSLCVGWKTVHIDKSCFWKEHGETSLDLGGAAKGYAVDLITERLQSAGYQNLYVEWGGEIRTAGSHPTGRPWKVAIRGGKTLKMRDQAIATSGSYFQNWTIDGDHYTHIIDPARQQPLQDPPIISASVVSSSCFEADALATALMLFPSVKEAKAWARSRGIRAYLYP
ncbi:MAG: FAD:protein FMN transferase [Chlamydiales bacterium]|nr:FAD:protein FMN transferase [Chlamydiales bacterium]